MTHAGLELTKFELPPGYTFKSEHHKGQLARAAGCGEPPGYAEAYERWRQEIHALPGVTLAATFQVDPDSRLATGIGAASVLETSIAMNRLWGMPIIPGPALKGLASHFAQAVHSRRGRLTNDHLADLFGTTEASSYLTWLDAWSVPGANEKPFELDVVTVHHRSWYQDPQKVPSDFEDPIPSYSLTARGSFLIAVQAPDEAWAVAGMTLLTQALDQWGIGAKTGSSGYGRLTFQAWQSKWKQDWDAEQLKARQAAAEELKKAAALQSLIHELDDPGVNANSRAHHWCSVWCDAELDEELRTQLGRQILERLRLDRRNYWRITGRVLPGQNKQPDNPKSYVAPLLAWMDEHAPGEFPP